MEGDLKMMLTLIQNAENRCKRYTDSLVGKEPGKTDPDETAGCGCFDIKEIHCKLKEKEGT